MKRPKKDDVNAKENLQGALQNETKQFEEYYLWLQEHMPNPFFEELEPEQLNLIAHYLMGFPLQDYFSHIHLKNTAFVLALDSPDADLRILKNFHLRGIKNYQTFLSDSAPPFPGIKTRLRIAVIQFTTFRTIEGGKIPLLKEEDDERYAQIKVTYPNVTFTEYQNLLTEMNGRFVRSLTPDHLNSAISMCLRAATRDYCQYEVIYNENWEKSAEEVPSMQIVFAWRNTPKHKFLFRLAKVIYRHNLKMTGVNAAYINPYSKNSILVMAIGLHGIKGKAAWEEADIQDFLQEIVLLKYFPDGDNIEEAFINTGLIRGNLGNLLRAMVSFIHQALIPIDIHLYSLPNIEEGLIRHPELTTQICKIFEYKFHPEKNDFNEYKKERERILQLIDNLDTGNEVNDTRRKNVLRQAIHFVDFTLKTNLYRNNKSALSFRISPEFLVQVPYDYKLRFPELPYGIFFIQGMHFIAFHIRFKDLSRGGLRTVIPQRLEQMVAERNNVFSECYNLAYTQQKKNKDIPEGGSKAVIFLEPSEKMESEALILEKELKESQKDALEIETIIKEFKHDQKLQYLYQTQRAFIHSLCTLINCHDDGTLKAKNVVDYWRKPEYIYLGPDENMHNVMIEWIAEYSKHCGYKLGSAFISSKPRGGINHKEYGITSFGINVYMKHILHYLSMNPEKEPFTIKISGGPDGDVAGNQILNLYKDFPKTAKLLALTDVSGTIYDPEGLDLSAVVDLFNEGKPIAAYPPKKLSNGAFLLDLQKKKEETAYTTKTLCWRKEKGKLSEDWLSGSDMNYLYRHNLHQVKTDIFIPGGGRPRTLNEKNYTDFLDEKGIPTAKAIVEGANLYLTPEARRALEKLGVIIIKDSSANKAGVICSSLEVLCSLTLTEEEFVKEKPALMKQIYESIGTKAQNEADLLLRTRDETGQFLTDISDLISEKINLYKYQLLDFFSSIILPSHPDDPLVRALLAFCPPLLAEKYRDRVIQKIPDIHKKAMIACYIASRLVYTRGLSWAPSIVEILPLIALDPKITPPNH